MYPEDACKMAFAQFPDLEVTYNFYQPVIKSLNNGCFDTIEAILTDCTKTNTPIDSVMKPFRKFQKALKLGFESEHSTVVSKEQLDVLNKLVVLRMDTPILKITAL